jgi:hypothetical protein
MIVAGLRRKRDAAAQLGAVAPRLGARGWTHTVSRRCKYCMSSLSNITVHNEPVGFYPVVAMCKYWMDADALARNNSRHGARNPDRQIE